MFQAITTRYLPPTNYRGARIVATAAAGRKIEQWDHGKDVAANHAAAALALANEWEWMRDGRKLCGGVVASGDYVWVFASDATDAINVATR